jgi:hypothetical protein
MAYCVFTNCLSILGSGITPYTSLDSRSGTGLTSNVGQMAFFGSSDNSGPLGMVFQHFCQYGMCRVDITSTRYGVSGNDLSLNVDSTNPYCTGGMLIKYGGGVAISTGQPCGALDVFKQGAGSTGTGDILIVRGGNNGSLFGTNQIRFGYAGSIGYSHAIKTRHQSASPYQNTLDFFLWTPSDAIEAVGTKNVMTLDGSGRVGINNCAPQFALHVNINNQLDGLIVENNCRNISCFKSATEHAFMYIDSAHQCTYQPAIFFMRAGNLFSELRLQRASSSDPLGSYTESEGLIGSTGNTPFSIESCGTRRIHLTSSGKIGMGNISPCAKLSVYTTSPHPNATGLSVAADACGTNLLARDSCFHNWFPYTDGLNYYSADAHTFRNGNHTTTWMQITSAGNVGINCTSPSYRLHVNGTFYAAGSSEEYKTSICQYDTNSCMFMKLKPVTYQYKDEYKHLGKELKSETQIGLIAEEVAETYPELAILVKENDNDVVRNVDYEKLSIVLLSEVQKLRKEVDDLKTK